jgi:hypothetical protein
VLDDDSAVVKTEKFDTMGKGTLIRKKYRIDFAGKNFQRYCVFGACNFLLKM